jgi:hypothetical protein
MDLDNTEDCSCKRGVAGSHVLAGTNARTYYSNSVNVLVQDAGRTTVFFKTPLENVVEAHLVALSDLDNSVVSGPTSIIGLTSNVLSGSSIIQSGAALPIPLGPPQDISLSWVQQYPLPRLSNQIPPYVIRYAGIGRRIDQVDLRLYDPLTNLDVTLIGPLPIYWILTCKHYREY